MPSRSIRGRLSAVVFASLICLWLIVLASIYLSRDWEERGIWPTAERIASILAIIEDTPAERQAALLSALQSQLLLIHIEEPELAGPAARKTSKIDEAITRRYAETLPGRAVTALIEVTPSPVPVGEMLKARPRRALEIRIGLSGRRTLVITAFTPLPVTSLGLPTGMMAGLVSSLIAVGALLILLRELRPLRQLARAVDQIGLDGKPIVLPDVRRQSSEIRSLVTAFDRLQRRLSQLLAGRMALFGGISHDLRTFATRLRLRIDLIEDDAQRERAEKDISDMIRLLDDALLATKIGAGDLTEELLDIEELVAAEADDLTAHGAAVKRMEKAGKARALVLGDRTGLRRVITNVLDNALKYAASAQIGVRSTDAHVIITVEDNGPGIPADVLDVVTEPFVRGEQSRNRDTGGSGLGLAVVRNLVEAHGGSIEIANRTEGGLRIEISLPRYDV